MKKILYIYGFGSSETSETGQRLNDILSPYGYEVTSIGYNQLLPEAGIVRLSDYIKKNNYYSVIGSSLGGFFALHLDINIKTIVINPCMYPSEALLKIGVPSLITKRYRPFEMPWDNRNIKPLGLFGTKDELIDFSKDFANLYGDNMVKKFEAKHRPTKKELIEVKDIILDYLS